MIIQDPEENKTKIQSMLAEFLKTDLPYLNLEKIGVAPRDPPKGHGATWKTPGIKSEKVLPS